MSVICMTCKFTTSANSVPYFRELNHDCLYQGFLLFRDKLLLESRHGRSRPGLDRRRWWYVVTKIIRRSRLIWIRRWVQSISFAFSWFTTTSPPRHNENIVCGIYSFNDKIVLCWLCLKQHQHIKNLMTGWMMSVDDYSILLLLDYSLSVYFLLLDLLWVQLSCAGGMMFNYR